MPRPSKKSGSKRLPTVEDVAREAGVSTATVSRVYSGFAGVSDKKRLLVEEAIAKLGYRPNIAAASLSHQKRSPGVGVVRVAVLTNYLFYEPAKTPIVPELIESGRERGFDVEHYDLSHDGPVPALLRRLYYRGFNALIFESLSQGSRELDPGLLAKFTLVSLDRRLQHFPCHLVRYDITEVMERTWDILTSRGYQRIGVIQHFNQEPHPDTRSFNELAQGLVATQPRPLRIPPFDTQKSNPSLKDWLRKHQPEVVIAMRPVQQAWIEDAGFSVPGDVACVALKEAGKGATDTSGWRQSLDQMASHSLDLTEQMIRRGAYGPRTHRLETIIHPEWIEGKTLHTAK